MSGSAAMTAGRANSWLFALPAPPAKEVRVGGNDYRLRRVFKHDFFAATCLYEADGQAAPRRIVVKLYRTQRLFGVPGQWLGRANRDHELGIYAALEGVEGVPRCLGPVGETGLAVEYVDAIPLDHYDKPPAGTFDNLRAIIDAVHARGVAYVDGNKRSNILVDPEGTVHLIDYQIAVRRRDDWPAPLGWLIGRIVGYFQQQDLYNVYKHKRRLAPEELTEQEEAISRRRTRLLRIHRKLTKPYRSFRRRFLGKRYRAGKLVSPTAELEDHYQPEKESWRHTRED